MTKFIQIDEEGYFVSQGLRVADDEYGRALFSALKYDTDHRLRTLDDAIVEAFDEPLVAQRIDGARTPDHLKLTMPYSFSVEAPLDSFTLDEWNRVHGYTSSGIAFVLSRAAQWQFFEASDSYDDESVTFSGRTYHLGPWLQAQENNDQPQFWDEMYLEAEVPRFDLEKPAPALMDLLDRLKLPKMRIAVLGAGPGHDAAHFAERGHLVTAFDFSEQACSQLRKLYGHIQNLTILQMDVLKMPHEYDRQFDLVFEHTCYCAIDPADRNKLVHVWNRILTERGQLLGVFFSMDKIGGPPYGGSEWEVRQRLQKSYQFVYWSRTHASKPTRLGKEFMVLATRR